MNIKLPLKVCVIGAGQVGSTFAYALMIRGLASEIVLVDINRSLAEGQAEDISHGLAYTPPARIYAGDYADCRDADIIVVTAGAAQKPGETRLDLMKKNVKLFRDMIPKITEQNKNVILIVISNPVDILTYAAVKFSELPSHRIIGSGTTLDSARFRYLLSRHCQVDPRNVHAYIVGEHGDSEVALWSLAQIAGMKVDQYCEQCRKECESIPKDKIFEQVRTAAYHLIEKKGATYHAIGLATVAMIEAIVRNQNSILTVSSLITNYHGIDNVCLSVPSVLNSKGVDSRIILPFSDEELIGLKHSANVLSEAIDKVGLAD